MTRRLSLALAAIIAVTGFAASTPAKAFDLFSLMDRAIYDRNPNYYTRRFAYPDADVAPITRPGLRQPLSPRARAFERRIRPNGLRISRSYARACAQRYRSYRASDNTFQPYRGGRRQCRL